MSNLLFRVWNECKDSVSELFLLSCNDFINFRDSPFNLSAYTWANSTFRIFIDLFDSFIHHVNLQQQAETPSGLSASVKKGELHNGVLLFGFIIL
jgi:hypothetical protein